MNLNISNSRLQPHSEGGSPILDVQKHCSEHTQSLMIMVFSVDLSRKHICKFKHEYLLIDKSTSKYLDKYQVLCLQVQVKRSTKYFRISKCQVQVSTKYYRFCIKYQVPVFYLTPTLALVIAWETFSHDSYHFRAIWKQHMQMYPFPKVRCRKQHMQMYPFPKVRCLIQQIYGEVSIPQGTVSETTDLCGGIHFPS